MTNMEQLIYSEITRATIELIGHGLSVDQEFPSNRQIGVDNFVIDWGDSNNLSIVFKNIEYKSIYDVLERERKFNVKLIDGALLQLMYMVKEGSVVSHRLAFFPSPYLEEFQNNPELYAHDDIYADILAKNIVPSPIRFDFNDDVHDDLHAKSHVTIGQYKNCRIPVSAPLSPISFINFILQNFYSTAYNKFQINMRSDIILTKTITSLEERKLHFNLVG